MNNFLEKLNVHTLLVLISMGLVAIVCVQIQKRNEDVHSSYNEMQKCITSKEMKTIRGNSMEPFLYPEEDIMAYMGYYECNAIERNDIVLISYVGNDAPIVKFVKGFPGDAIQTKKEGGKWNVYVNEQILKNSENVLYALSDEAVREIQNYERAYGGIIPKKRYLIFGNLSEGSMDSSKFGLIGEESIVAKVEKME